MQPTLITDFADNADWLEDLQSIFETQSTQLLKLRIWVRDKELAAEKLPLSLLRRTAQKYQFQIQWSWCHRHQAQPQELLHIPDDDMLRTASQAVYGRRILSCHSIHRAQTLLTMYPRDQVLMSPWAPSLSKSQRHQPLNHDAVIGLSKRFPYRIHLTSGLTPSDFAHLQQYPFVSLCFLGALRQNMASCLEQLQAQYQLPSAPL